MRASAVTAADACVTVRPGRLVEIPDADGELHDYRLGRAPAGLDAWACTLERLGGGPTYRVALTLAGSWRCQCADAHYRARKARRFCKHVRHVQPLYQILEELSHDRREEETR